MAIDPSDFQARKMNVLAIVVTEIANSPLTVEHLFDELENADRTELEVLSFSHDAMIERCRMAVEKFNEIEGDRVKAGGQP